MRSTPHSPPGPVATDRKKASIPDGATPAFHVWRYNHLLLASLDLLAIFCSYLAAYMVRFDYHEVLAFLPPPAVMVPPIGPYIRIAGIMSLSWVFILAHEQAYSRGLHLSTSLADRIIAVLTSGIYALFFLMVVSFSFRYFLLSRLVYSLGFLFSLAGLVFIRLIFHLIDRRLDSRCLILNRVVFLGRHQRARQLLDHIHQQNPCTCVLGWISWSGNAPDREISDLRSLGDAGRIREIHAQRPFDQLIMSDLPATENGEPSADRAEFIETLNFCEQHGIKVYMVPDVIDVTVTRQEVGSLAGVPLIGLRDSALHPLYAMLKRVLDLLISGTVIVLGLPFWLTVAAVIKATSKGPVLYIEERIGLHGQPFRMFKFRSMVEDADGQLADLVDFDQLKEPVFNIRRDPRVTAFGAFLRRSSLDEVPQLLNIFLGSMSLVGPRPERTALVERYNPYQRRRLKAKPGLTGYQQVMSRGDPSLTKRIEYDLWYLKHQSFLLDLFIILKTFLVVFRGDGFK